MPTLSIIIPTLNEAEVLPTLLDDLSKQQDLDIEILVADGGSTDTTADIARQHGARVIETDAGRARQMNLAAARARGEYLLFLHADSRLEYPQQLALALYALLAADDGRRRTAGHFPLRFSREKRGHELAFRYMQAKTRLNRRHCQNGDQGLLLHRDFFASLGGYDETMPFFEDFRLAERIHAKGRWLSLPGRLTTSARRFETEGVSARYLLMGLIVTAEQADIPEFIRQAPRLYASQDATGQLLLTPYFRTFAVIARQRGLTGSWQALRNIGRLSRLHWWQCFFFFDVLLGLRNRPLLRFYDRVVYPLTANIVGDTFSAVLAWVVGMWLLRPYFRLREKHALQQQASESP